MIKKGFTIVLSVLLVLVVCSIVFFKAIIHYGIEKVGSKMTRCSVELREVSISPFSGYGEIRGLVLKNPSKYNTPIAITCDQLVIDLDPVTLFSDCVNIRKIFIKGPRISYESSFTGSNLSEIAKNVESYAHTSSQGKKSEKQKRTKKVIIDQFLVQEGIIQLSANTINGVAVEIPLPEINLRDIGKSSHGTSPSDVAHLVFTNLSVTTIRAISLSDELINQGSQTIGNVLRNGTDGAQNTVKKIEDSAKEGASKVLKGLFDKGK